MRSAFPVMALAGLLTATSQAFAQSGEAPPGVGTQVIYGDELRRTLVPADPYEPLGIRAGRYVLYPTLDTTVGVTTEKPGTSAAFATIAPALRIESDWSRHAATLVLRGSYGRTFDGVTADEPTAGAEADLRLDLRDSWTVDLSAYYDYSRQSDDDPDTPSGLDDNPGVHGFGAGAALSGGAGRLRTTLSVAADRADYENGTSGGAVVDQGDRTNTLASARLRLGYRTGGTLTPFVEGQASRRFYDRPVDSDGLRRSSTGFAGRAGVEIDRGPVITGELSAGYATEQIDDPALAGLASFTLDGSLVWAPTRLTTVTAFASTSLSPSTDAASSGSVTHGGGLTLAYAWRPHLTLQGSAGLGRQTFEGTGRVDLTANAGLEAIWRLNRKAQLSAGYVHEWVDSTDSGADEQTGTVEVRLRLQH